MPRATKPKKVQGKSKAAVEKPLKLRLPARKHQPVVQEEEKSLDSSDFESQASTRTTTETDLNEPQEDSEEELDVVESDVPMQEEEEGGEFQI